MKFIKGNKYIIEYNEDTSYHLTKVRILPKAKLLCSYLGGKYIDKRFLICTKKLNCDRIITDETDKKFYYWI